MLERLLGPERCRVHNRVLEPDSVPVRYGLIKFRAAYRKAWRTLFPHAKNFVLGGCRVGPPREQSVWFCPDCRAAEIRWKQENPDFNDPAHVFFAVETERRELPDSLAKRLLRQSQLDKPEPAGRFLWIAYRLSLEKVVAYNAEKRSYLYPYTGENFPIYGSVDELSKALNAELKDE